MESTQRNARILEVIGYIQFLPFTILIIGTIWTLIIPPTLLALEEIFFEGFSVVLVFLWIIGVILFGFYVRHSRAKQIINKRARRFWLGSMIFNAIGLLVPLILTLVILSATNQSMQRSMVYSTQNPLVNTEDSVFNFTPVESMPSRREDSGFDFITAALIFWSAGLVLHIILSFRSFRSLHQPESQNAVSNENFVV